MSPLCLLLSPICGGGMSMLGRLSLLSAEDGCGGALLEEIPSGSVAESGWKENLNTALTPYR